MARDFAKRFYNSAAWQKCRMAFIAERIAIDGGVCQRCGQELGYIAHHRAWLTPENIADPDVALNRENLEYVCHICHNRIEEGEAAPRCRFTPDGQVEAYPPIRGGRAGLTETALGHPYDTQGDARDPPPLREEMAEDG